MQLRSEVAEPYVAHASWLEALAKSTKQLMISKRIIWSCLRKGGCCCDVAVIGGEVAQVAARLLPK